MDLIIYGPEVFVLKLILYWIMTPGLVVSLKNYNAYSPINLLLINYYVNTVNELLWGIFSAQVKQFIASAIEWLLMTLN